MVTINKKIVLRYLVPFSFRSKEQSDNYKNVYDALVSSDLWEPYTNKGETDIYDYFYNSVCENGTDSNIGTNWKYNLRNKNIKLCYNMDKDATKHLYWEINDVGLYVFRTNVGFFWFEISPSKKQSSILTSSELLTFQNQIKSFSRTEQYLNIIHPKKHKEDVEKIEAFSLAKWTNDVLSPLTETIDYLYGSCIKNGVCCPEKALIFNYLLFEKNNKDENELSKMAYRFSNGYTEKYLVSNEALLDVKHPFENVFWCASKNGCGYYACMSDNNAFFQDDLFVRIKKEYFFMYILALYQSYSIQLFSKRIICEQSCLPMKYYERSNDGDKLDIMILELNTFFMKGVHTSISNIQHHNDFLNYVKDRLQIKEEIDTVKSGAEALANIQRMNREKEEEKQAINEEKRQTEQNNKLSFALAAISIFSMLEAFIDTNAILNKLEKISFISLWKQIITGNIYIILEIFVDMVIAIIAIVCAMLIIKNILNHHKMKKYNQTKK